MPHIIIASHNYVQLYMHVKLCTRQEMHRSLSMAYIHIIMHNYNHDQIMHNYLEEETTAAVE